MAVVAIDRGCQTSLLIFESVRYMRLVQKGGGISFRVLELNRGTNRSVNHFVKVLTTNPIMNQNWNKGNE